MGWIRLFKFRKLYSIDEEIKEIVRKMNRKIQAE